MTASETSSELVDLLIVGGGPAGVAAALRGVELGISVRILEADDTMRRIRDYSKHKHILPSFGGGDRLAFPEGGEWISKLPFEPIDKDDLVAAWKEVCREAGVKVESGIEMTGLADGDDGTLHVEGYDHRDRRDVRFEARHVALAVGRGVPRRFDIPGDTAGIARRLVDADQFVGAPVCVIGGGTSAAEAVIAISQAKEAAGDRTPVNWSYRGDRLPKVSKALAEAFFAAYVGNGNIRYRPLSEPLMVLSGEDHNDYLAIRVDRRHVADRPVETTLLEFPVERCLACVGEDVPEAFLATLDIPMVVGGDRNRKRMVVTRLLESRRPRVYLLGDLLSQAYLETSGVDPASFDADPSTFREVRHRGNIKSALHDGVRVAEVVRQRLDGVADAEIHLPEIAETEAAPARKAAVPVATEAGSDEGGSDEAASDQPAWLVHLVSGGDGDEHRLDTGAVVTLGSGDCDLSFPADPLMASLHATVVLEGETAMLRDGGAPNGIFLQLPARRKVSLQKGDLLRVGRQFLLVDLDSEGFAVVHYRSDGSEAGRHRLTEGATVVGRKADLILDPEDATLSRRQLAFTAADGRLLVKDLLSVNGTYLRIADQRRLQHGDRFLAGQQHFAFSTQRDAVFDRQGPAPKTGSWTITQADLKKVGNGAPSVTFQPSGKVCPVVPGQTLLDVAEAHGIPIAAECRAGVCGSDPLRILSGRENLEAEPLDGEAETLEDLCGLEAGPCRLACMATVKGAVEVEILGSG
ncbi:MAG: NAD(P)-binding domain-containing protein [Thermoanaerobaculia bacterium]|nr:NAD(P)-binding domain-containing protein [Thermoanaerobaculia bacterium]